MSSKLPYLMVRLPAEFIARWKSHHVGLGMTGNNAAKLAMSRFMGDQVNPIPPRFVAIPESRDGPRHRQEVRLTNSEIEAIDKRAQCRGISRRQYLVNLIRGDLLRAPQLSKVELDLVRESNTRLTAIGSNLNQIAKKFNSGDSVEARAVLDAVNRAVALIEEHRPYIYRLLRSNLDRWVIAEAPDDQD